LDRAQHLTAELQQHIDCHALSLDNLLTSRGRLIAPNPPSADVSARSPQPHARTETPKSLILNAASLGMHEDASLLPLEILARFPPGTLVFDMIYNPRETQLLRQA